MKVKLSSILTSYTDGKRLLDIEGGSLSEVINNLDQKYPGIKFRFITEHQKIRPHINLFLNKTQIRDLDHVVSENDELFIVQSLSGG